MFLNIRYIRFPRGIARLSGKGSASRTPPFTMPFLGHNSLLGGLQRFQNLDENGNLFMPPDAANLRLCYQEAGTDPEFALIDTMPAFYVTANGFDDGEGRLNYVSAGQSHSQLPRHAKPENG